jgi:MFS family permease
MRHRNYRLLWGGQLVSFLGDRIHWVAISLWVYAATGSALSVSYAILALLVAPALVGLFAGAIVDRMSRRTIMIAADLTRAGLVALIPTLMDVGLPWVYGALALVSAATAFFRPAMYAAIPQSVPRDQLLQANAFFASLDSAAEVIGPALAGLVVASFGYTAAIYANAASFLVSAAFVSGLRLPAVERAAPDRSGLIPNGVLESIREGLRYVRADRIHVALLGLLFMGHWVAGLNSLQTPLAKGILAVTDQQFGWFQSIWGLGFVGASVVLGWYGRRIPRGQAIVLGYVFWAASAAAMALAPNFGMLVTTGFWVGFANIIVFVNVGTIMMEHTPTDRIGRAITVRQVSLAMVRVAALLGFGWLADVVGIREAILAMAGVAGAGSIVAGVMFPALWRYRAAPSPPSIEVSPQVERQLAEPAWSYTLNRAIAARLEPDFVAEEQRWLNAATMGIVGLGWGLLLLTSAVHAVGIAAAIAGVWLIAAGVKRSTLFARARMMDRGRR